MSVTGTGLSVFSGVSDGGRGLDTQFLAVEVEVSVMGAGDWTFSFSSRGVCDGAGDWTFSF